MRTKAAVFDFDGTLSTLRSGWETVMRPLMLEMIPCSDAETAREVDAYIDESTGIQTIFQMKWLAERVARAGGPLRDPWEYKAEYNRRLLREVDRRREAVERGEVPRENYLIDGAEAFLREIKARRVRVFVASGTDHPDVVREAGALGLLPLFDDLAGAPPHEEKCSKEAVLRRLIEQNGLSGGEVTVIGDGKVEIALGRAIGARTLGLATDEEARHGVNGIKRARLEKAGADKIAGDFLQKDALLAWMELI